MTNGITPLSLAYMVEISFVVNLAYHELDTFRLRDKLKKQARDVLSRHRQMYDGNDTLVQPEWGFLNKFHSGDGAAWENKWIGHLYRWFIYKGFDRTIVRSLLMIEVVLLLFLTLFANVDVSPIYGPDIPTAAYYWWLAFWFLVISLAIPPIFMLLSRKCEKYAFGCVEEQDSESAKGGRLKQLEDEALKKIQALIRPTVSAQFAASMAR